MTLQQVIDRVFLVWQGIRLFPSVALPVMLMPVLLLSISLTGFDHFLLLFK